MRISEQICNLDKYITEKNIKKIEFIKNKLFEALSSIESFNTKKLFENFVYQDCDPLGKKETKGIEEGDRLWDEVRDIQNDMINDYGMKTYE